MIDLVNIDLYVHDIFIMAIQIIDVLQSINPLFTKYYKHQ